MPSDSPNPKRIVVVKDGAYSVEYAIPLVSKTQVISEHGEPLTWRNDGEIPVFDGWYCLCRCGQSGQFPFCDGTHREVGFDGAETADTGLSEQRALTFPGGTCIIVKKDVSLCTDAGFCGLRDKTFQELIQDTADTQVRSLVIAMVERCPSGALTYRMAPEEKDIEPDLPQQIAVTIEITPDGPIAGPLWVTGGIPVVRADGQPFETRQRVTLCNCGHSGNKPLCDGAHRDASQMKARQVKITRLPVDGAEGTP